MRLRLSNVAIFSTLLSTVSIPLAADDDVIHSDETPLSSDLSASIPASDRIISSSATKEGNDFRQNSVYGQNDSNIKERSVDEGLENVHKIHAVERDSRTANHTADHSQVETNTNLPQDIILSAQKQSDIFVSVAEKIHDDSLSSIPSLPRELLYTLHTLNVSNEETNQIHEHYHESINSSVVSEQIQPLHDDNDLTFDPVSSDSILHGGKTLTETEPYEDENVTCNDSEANLCTKAADDEKKSQILSKNETLSDLISPSSNSTIDESTIGTEQNNQTSTLIPDANNVVSTDNDDDDDGDTSQSRVSVDYASKSSGAIILDKSKGFKGTSNLLVDDDDRYAISPCDIGNGGTKFVIIALSEDILVKTIKLLSYERYSSQTKQFQVLGSQTYPISTKWYDLGTFTAKPWYNTNGQQTFELEQGVWARYLKFRFLSHYGNEHYCTITRIMVHGSTTLQGFHEGQWDRGDETETNDLYDDTTEQSADTSINHSDSNSIKVHKSDVDVEIEVKNSDEKTNEGDKSIDENKPSQQSVEGSNNQHESKAGKIQKASRASINEASTHVAADENSRDHSSNKKFVIVTSSSFLDSSEISPLSRLSEFDISKIIHGTTHESFLNLHPFQHAYEAVRDDHELGRNALSSASITLFASKMAKSFCDDDKVRLEWKIPSVGTSSMTQAEKASYSAILGGKSTKTFIGLKRIRQILNFDMIGGSKLSWSGRTKEQYAENIPKRIENRPATSSADEINHELNCQNELDYAVPNQTSPEKSSTSETGHVLSSIKIDIKEDLLLELIKRFPAAECLGRLNQQDFKARLNTQKSGAKGNGTHGTSSTGSVSKSAHVNEPIFKILTDEIKLLQANQAVHDHFIKTVVNCYQTVVATIMQELVHTESTLERRLVLIEEHLLMEATEKNSNFLHTILKYFILTTEALSSVNWASKLRSCYRKSSQFLLSKSLYFHEIWLQFFLNENIRKALNWIKWFQVEIIAFSAGFCICFILMQIVAWSRKKIRVRVIIEQECDRPLCPTEDHVTGDCGALTSPMSSVSLLEE